MSEAQAAAVARKLALALQEAHARGVIHRDLKPANIMVNRRRDLVIMDFGLARMAGGEDGALTRTGHVLGTALYMAPEQAAGDVAATGTGCDIYALGVILFELLTGYRPFEGPWSLVIGLKNVKDPDPPSKHRPDLSPAIDAICLKAIAQRPEDRYATMAEFAEALTDFLASATSPDPVAKLDGASIPDDDSESQAARVFEGIVDREFGRSSDREFPADPAMAGGGADSGRRRGFPWIIAAVGTTVVVLGIAILATISTGRNRSAAVDPLARVQPSKTPARRIVPGKPIPDDNSLSATAGTEDDPSEMEDLDEFEGAGPGDPFVKVTTPPMTGPGLVAFYNFDDGKLTDNSGRGHQGVFGPNPPTFTAEGHQGGAFRFYDHEQLNYIDIPVNINPSVMPKITMGGWFKTRSTAIRGLLIGHDNGNFDRTLNIETRGARWSVFKGSGIFHGEPVVLGKWTFVAMRHDEANGRLILDVDGHRSETVASFGPGNRIVRIGRHPRYRGGFDGTIDNVFIYSFVLSDDQIAEIRSRGEAAILAIGTPVTSLATSSPTGPPAIEEGVRATDNPRPATGMLDPAAPIEPAVVAPIAQGADKVADAKKAPSASKKAGRTDARDASSDIYPFQTGMVWSGTYVHQWLVKGGKQPMSAKHRATMTILETGRGKFNARLETSNGPTKIVRLIHDGFMSKNGRFGWLATNMIIEKGRSVPQDYAGNRAGNQVRFGYEGLIGMDFHTGVFELGLVP